MKDVAVIIINYNTSKYTKQCVDSVIQNTDKTITYEIIVIDNNSDDEDYKNLINSIPKLEQIRVYRSVINTGFGGGNMQGVQYANSKYLLFLNNDAYLQNDCLKILSEYMASHPEIGVATAQNYDENGQHVASFDHNKGIRKLLLGRSFLEKNFPAQHPKRKKKYDSPVNVNYVNGAFMFFRSEIFARVGGFDTNIFLYFEEMDICKRILDIGYSSSLVPSAKITHYQGVSTGTSKPISKEGMISYMYVIKKNYSYAKYIGIRLYFCLTFVFKPKKWFLLALVFKGVPLSESLKQKQKISFNYQ